MKNFKRLKQIIISVVLVLSMAINFTVCFATENKNIALGKTVTANTGASTVQGVIDSDNTNANSSNAWIVQANAAEGAWVNIALNGLYAVSSIKIYHGYSDGNNMMQNYDIYYSKSKEAQPADSEYKLLKSFTNLAAKDVINTIDDSVTARHIKLVSKTTNQLLRIREIEIFGAATEGDIPTAVLSEIVKTQSGADVTLSVRVSKNDFEINSVKFYLNSQLLGEGDTQDNVNYKYTVSAIANGEYQAYAEVSYGENKTVTSNKIDFIAFDLSADILIDWISPSENVVNSGEAVNISARTTEQNGATTQSAEMYVNEELASVFNRNEDNIYTITRKFTPGEYNIKIKATTADGKVYEKSKIITVPISQITDFTGFTVSAINNGGDSSSTPDAVIDGITNSFTGKYKWYINTNPEKAWLIINFPSDYEITDIIVDSGYTDKEVTDPTAEVITDYSFMYSSNDGAWSNIDGAMMSKDSSELVAEDFSKKFTFEPTKMNKLKLVAGANCKTFRIREIRMFGYKVNNAPKVAIEKFRNDAILLNTMDIEVCAAISDDGNIENTVLYIDGVPTNYILTEDTGKYKAVISAGSLSDGIHTVNISAVDDYAECGSGNEETIKIVSESGLLDILANAARENFVSTFNYVTEYLNIDKTKLDALPENVKQAVYFQLMEKDFEDSAKLSSAIGTAIEEATKVNVISPSPSGGGGSVSNKKGYGDSAPVVNNTPEVSPKEIFDDLDSVTWAKTAIEYLYNKKIVSGTDEHSFSPLKNVTRGQFVKMIVRAFSIEASKKDILLSDVEENNIFYDEIIAAASNEIVCGYEDNTFRSDDFISRQDMAVLLRRALKYVGQEIDEDKNIAFTDNIADYAKESVISLCTAGVFNGVGDNRFAPEEMSNRAMAAKVIYQAKMLLK